jgi:hypothetical protein
VSLDRGTQHVIRHREREAIVGHGDIVHCWTQGGEEPLVDMGTQCIIGHREAVGVIGCGDPARHWTQGGSGCLIGRREAVGVIGLRNPAHRWMQGGGGRRWTWGPSALLDTRRRWALLDMGT